MTRYTPSGQVTTIPQNQAEFEKIQAAINDTLSRKGDAPNGMEADFDMNSNRILNLPAPSALTEPLRLSDLDSFLGGNLSIDLSSVTKVIDNVDTMKGDSTVNAGDVVFCKKYYSGGNLVEGLVYEIQSSGTADGYIDHAVVNGVAKLIHDNTINIEQAGGRENTDSSLAIRAIASAGKTVYLPAKRYLYDRVAIPQDVKIVGEKMPNINASYTSLEGGSILQGTVLCTGKNVHLENFGVDLGTATGETDGDGIKARYGTLNSGGHLHTENIIALLPASSTAFHATLFESYTKHTGDNVVGVHGFFGFVNKCQNVQIDKIYTERNQSDGVYFKSDATDGKASNINVGKIIVDGNSVQTFGLRLQSAGDSIDSVNIGSVIIDGCARPYKCDLNGTNGTSITNVTIDSLITKNATSRDVHIENAKASGSFIYNHTIKRLVCIDTLLEGYKADGSGTVDFVNLEDAFISFDSSVSNGQIEAGGVQIGSNVLRTKMDKITVVRNYSTSGLGGINYSNQSVNNQLGMRTAKVFGSGTPLSGDSSQSISGASATLIVPNPPWNGKHCNTRCQLTADATITSFTENREQGVAALFETGTTLTIINNSNFTLTINHNSSGNILNRGSLNLTLAANETAQYVYGGASWHQLG